MRFYRTFSPLPTVAAVCDRRRSALTERRYNFGGMFSVALSVGTPRGIRARVYPGVRLLASAAMGYAASRPVVFGLSAPALLS